MKKMTKKEFEDYVNFDVEIPPDDRKSNGGRIPDHAPYGTWLRKNDPVAFEIAYRELES